jgi:two-component system sensor histidine kinase HydH
VLELEASSVSDLEARAQWSLLIGSASALLLSAVALLLWRQALERERTAALLAQQRRLSALGEMAAVLAHEIKNPLASLQGNAEVLAELAESPAPATEALRRKARWQVKEASRLSALLDDLLDFSRSGPLERQATPLRPLLEAAVEEVDASRVRLDLAAAPSSWSVDATRLRQVLANLLRNAVQATPPDRQVELRAQGNDGRLLITVRDHGEGLPAGVEEQIFEPFFTTRSRGTGLGLAVSRRIVESHGGSLTARNHPEGGAELRVVIPQEGG